MNVSRFDTLILQDKELQPIDSLTYWYLYNEHCNGRNKIQRTKLHYSSVLKRKLLTESISRLENCGYIEVHKNNIYLFNILRDCSYKHSGVKLPKCLTNMFYNYGFSIPVSERLRHSTRMIHICIKLIIFFCQNYGSQFNYKQFSEWLNLKRMQTIRICIKYLIENKIILRTNICGQHPGERVLYCLSSVYE